MRSRFVSDSLQIRALFDNSSNNGVDRCICFLTPRRVRRSLYFLITLEGPTF